MALGWTTTPDPDDEQLQGHETTYRPSLGGWYPAEEKPVPGLPKGQQDD